MEEKFFIEKIRKILKQYNGNYIFLTDHASDWSIDNDSNLDVFVNLLHELINKKEK